MHTRFRSSSFAALPLALLVFTLPAHSQQNTTQTPAPQQDTAGHDVGSGAGDIGKGAGGAVGNVAKGTGKGAVDLATLHPLNAAGNIGKGAGIGAKDAGVGAVKGTSKIAKGTGRGVGHLFHHSHKDADTSPQG
jgi:hypothetical protein